MNFGDVIHDVDSASSCGYEEQSFRSVGLAADVMTEAFPSVTVKLPMLNKIF